MIYGKFRMIRFLGSALTGMALAAILIIGLNGIAMADGDTASDSLSDAVIAIVNNDTLYASSLDTLFMKVHSQMSDRRKEEFDYKKLLNKLVNDRLITQEATMLGLDQEDWLVNSLERQRRRNAIRQFVAENFSPDTEPSVEQIHDYFEKNYRKMQIRSIAVQSLDQAQEIYESIKNGASMDSAAQAVSVDMYKYKGGLHNLKYYGDIEREIRDKADNLQPGELSRPFPYRQAFSLIRIEKSLPADQNELPDKRDKIVLALRQVNREDQWRSFVRDLEEKYRVNEDSALLEEIMADSSELFSPGFTEGSDQPVLYLDDGFGYSDEELRKNISYTAMNNADKPFDNVLKLGLKAAREEFVLSAAARSKGYFDHPAVMAKYDKSLDSALIEIYLKETVVSGIKFSHKEFDEYYNEHLDDFREPDQYQLDQVIVKNENEAREIEKRLSEGADFDYIVSQYRDGDDELIEDVDWMTLQAFPDEVADNIRRLDIVESSRAFQVAEGWIIFNLRGHRRGEPKPMADVEMKIREVMFQKKFDEKLDEILAALKENSVIIYNNSAIKQYFGEEP